MSTSNQGFSSQGFSSQDSGSLGANILSAALIGPHEQRRKEVAAALVGSQASLAKEFSSYPSLDDVPQLLEDDYDVIIVELDSNPEHALDLVEHICANGTATVMVYSALSDSEMLVRCMRAGAREFLPLPIAPSTIAEALVRASVRRPTSRPAKKVGGKLLVFFGAKGGCGVTTIASNFAVALAQESNQSTALIDFDLPLGDAAINLGLTPQFSTANALENFARLDNHFFTKLLIKHSSGLRVLAAPDSYVPVDVSEEALDKLLSIARQEFEYVVVDAGSNAGGIRNALFEAATSVYLVAQVGISELRNCNRLVTAFFAGGNPKLKVVLNRYAAQSLGLGEESITRALTRQIDWKIPSDYNAAREAQNTATPLALENSPVSKVIRQMARAASGLPPAPARKRGGLSIFG